MSKQNQGPNDERYPEGKERVLYSNEKELVTDRRVVLGEESWDIRNIVNVELVSRPYFWMVKMTRRHIPGVTAGVALMLLYFSGILWASYIPYGGCLQFLLLMLSIGTILFTVLTNPGELYTIELKLEDGRIQETQYRWQEKAYAEQITKTLLELIKSRTLES